MGTRSPNLRQNESARSRMEDLEEEGSFDMAAIPFRVDWTGVQDFAVRGLRRTFFPKSISGKVRSTVFGKIPRRALRALAEQNAFMAGTTTVFCVSLPPEMAKEPDRVKKEEHRTRSELVREALRHYIRTRSSDTTIFR